MDSSSNQKCPKIALGLMAVGTCLFHLAFGLYYITHAENLPARLTLQAHDTAYLESYPGWNTDHERDSTVCNRAAMEILRTGVPRTKSGALLTNAPLYVYFVAACYWIGGVRLLSVAVPNAILAGLTCYFIGLAAYRLAGRQRVWAMWLAALLVLINLRIAMYVGYVYPTWLHLFLISVAFAAATNLQNGASVVAFVAAIVLCIYTEAAFIFMGLACACWLLFVYFWRDRSIRCLIGALVVVLLACAKLLAGVTDVCGGKDDSLHRATQGILWDGNNPYHESMRWSDLWEHRPGNPWSRWKVSPDEQRRYEDYLNRGGGIELNAAVLWIRENPAQYLKVCVIRMRTWAGPFTMMMSPRNRAISTLFWLLIFPAGVYAFGKRWQHQASRLVLLLVLADFALETFVILEPYLRYRLPIDLILTAYAGIGYSELWRRMSRKEAASPSPATELHS